MSNSVSTGLGATAYWTRDTIVSRSWNLLVHIQKTEWWISCVNVGEGHFFLLLLLLLSLSDWVRVRKEEALKLCPVSCTEQQRRKKKKMSWPSSRLLLFSCVTATFAPVWRTFISTSKPPAFPRTAGYGYRVFTYKNISVTRRWHSFYYRHVLHMDRGALCSTVGEDVNKAAELAGAQTCGIALWQRVFSVYVCVRRWWQHVQTLRRFVIPYVLKSGGSAFWELTQKTRQR